MADIMHPLARQVSMTDPTATTPSLKDAVTLHETGQLAEAQAVYSQILDVSPNDLRALHGLALVILDMGQPQGAIPLLMRCITLEPNAPAFRLALGIALLRGGKAEDAAAQLLETSNAAPHLVAPRLYIRGVFRSS
jgi:protein O-GlcNAc transferase